ncbi:MAG: PilZ domain-containing protein [Myxococcota bacterium]
MSDERRSSERYVLWFPMRIETEGDVILSISRDISDGGVLVVAAAEPHIGASVNVTLEIPGDEAGERTVKGKIVRVEANEADEQGLWRHRVAVAFDEVIPELDPILQSAERISHVPGEPKD